MLIGNLLVPQIERELGITLTELDRGILNSMRQDTAAHIAPGKWHCFDMPFVLLCGDRETAKKIVDILTPHAKEMRKQLQISIEGKG